jgi:hypothetical protein
LRQENITGFSAPGLTINGKVSVNGVPTHLILTLFSGYHCRLAINIRRTNAVLTKRIILLVYPNGQFGPGKNGNDSHRAWQGAPYSPVSWYVIGISTLI